MGLNIKNERVHQLAREAARRLDASQTSAIEQALERMLADLDRAGGGSDRASAILADIDARLTDGTRASLTTDVLYGEDGLPA